MCSISLIKWVEIIAVDSSEIFSIINFNISFLVTISTPAIGSSNIYIFASLDSINIKFNFSIFPLDKFFILSFRFRFNLFIKFSNFLSLKSV